MISASQMVRSMLILLTAFFLYCIYFFSPRFVPEITLWQRQLYFLIPISLFGISLFKCKIDYLRSNLKNILFLIIISTLISLLFTLIFPTYLKLLGFDSPHPIPQSIGSFSILTLAMIPALSEELFFRGFLLHSLSKYLNTNPSILISSFLFALCHLSPMTFPFYFILGMLFGFTFKKYGLIPSTICHLVYNITQLLSVNLF